MKKQIKNTQDVSRKDALKKINADGITRILTAIGTYLILNPQKAQAQSPSDPGTGF